MARAGEQLSGRGAFDNSPRVHDDDPFDQSRDDPEIVRHPHHGHARASLDLFYELEYLLLNRDVERRCRLVGDEQTGRHGKGVGDHDPLEHAPRQLVGECPLHPLRVGQANLAQDLPAPGAGRVAWYPVGAEGLHDLCPHP